MLINNFEIEINRKQVKNINLRVYPDLTIKAVERMIILKEEWINKQLKKYEEQGRIARRSYVSGEDHYLNGKRYILKVCDSNTPSIKIENNNTIMMYVRKSSSIKNKEKLLNCFCILKISFSVSIEIHFIAFHLITYCNFINYWSQKVFD